MSPISVSLQLGRRLHIVRVAEHREVIAP